MVFEEASKGSEDKLEVAVQEGGKRRYRKKIQNALLQSTRVKIQIE